MDQVDGDVEVEQVLQQGVVVVPGLLHEHEDLLQRRGGRDSRDQVAETLARVGTGQRRAALEALVALQQRPRDKAGDMPVLANVDTHVERLAGQQRHWTHSSTSTRGAGVRVGHIVHPPSLPTSTMPAGRQTLPSLPYDTPPGCGRFLSLLRLPEKRASLAKREKTRCLPARVPPAARAGRGELHYVKANN